jgi:alkanesulfonate monooxygenase SsuD/methylene tetrahydromethanopterin reductase-like flavin-dependent oxidoreductase (luciferase family)
MFTLPETSPPIYIAASGEAAARMAAEVGEGIIGTKPDPELLQTFERHGGGGKPRLGQLTVCWAQRR